MIAFFLQNQYPRRTAWGRMEDHYFFVLYSMLVLAGFAIFGVWMLPDVSHQGFWRQVAAHALATAGAGMCGAFAVTAVGGLLLCILPMRAFNLISPMLRAGLVTVLALLLVHYVRFGDVLDRILNVPFGRGCMGTYVLVPWRV